MPMPNEYQHACEDFDRFLTRARDEAGLATRNQTYTMVEGVLVVFRRRLTMAQAIAFAGALPPMLRALFVADWHIGEPVRPFADRAALTREVQALRRHHNFAPENAIAAVAAALWHVADRPRLQACLAALPPEAAAFWAADEGG